MRFLGCRSLSGCWTCRLRKTMCDETKPSCLTCGSVGLCCDGYGSIPSWKDGGLKESRYLAMVKSRVKENFRQKCQLRVRERRHTYSNSESHEQAIEGPVFSQRANLPADGHSRDISSVRPTVDYNKQQSPDLVTDPIFEQDIPHNVSHSMPIAKIFANYIMGGASMSDNIEEEYFNIHADKSQDHTSTILQNKPTASISFSPLASPDPLPDDMDSDSASVIDTLSEGSRPLRSDILEYNLWKMNARELELVMYYIDTVFYTQFPFYSPASVPERRGWLYGLLREIRPFYNACLSLSSYADALLHCEVEIEEVARLRESDEYFSKATTELNKRLQSQLQDAAPSKDGIATAMCIIQLLSLELFRGGIGNWRLHLQTALTLLSRHIPMLQQLPSAVDSSIYARQENSNAWCVENQLLKFAFTVFLWFEVIACASENLPPSLFPPCKHLLESGVIDLRWVTGCENWVWLQIAEITALLSWKNNSRRLGVLSMRELTQRATIIEKQLVERGEEQSRATHSKCVPPFSGIGVHDVNAVTTIFSLAALTYLHVVVSGPNPHLPEIRSSVSKTLTVLRELRYPQLIRSLAWPFCVTGCLAEKRDHAAVKDLLVLSGISPEGVGNLWSAFRIVEECWRLRESEQGRWEWRGVMASLDEHVFLV
ncbi:fungal-specific transcription factor domain-containing protein [Xylogone sp. PMI_703]|nr:fungal-specific transcription factor domain-containing protein [Xylogone sp. PMI_703]